MPCSLGLNICINQSHHYDRMQGENAKIFRKSLGKFIKIRMFSSSHKSVVACKLGVLVVSINIFLENGS